MATTLLSLPPELLDRIFALLTPEFKSICSSRLVSRTFKEFSSPYLVTRAVFASRLKATTKLKELLNHPYFHKHVTELVYDASYVDETIALDQDLYGTEYAAEERTRKKDQTWIDRIVQHDQALDLVDEIEPSDIYMHFGGPNKVIQADSIIRSFCNGAYGTYPDYYMHYRAHHHLSEIWEMDNKLLRLALTGFPKLKSLVYTDWRGLTRYNETYSQCASRLFADMLAPKKLWNTGRMVLGIFEILDAVIRIPRTSIKSFTVRAHPYEDTQVAAYGQESPLGAFMHAHEFYMEGDLNQEEIECHLEWLFGGLQSLQLAFSVSSHAEGSWGSAYQDSGLKWALQGASQLVRLRLEVLESPHNGMLKGEEPGKLFNYYLSEMSFPHLQHLDLRNWYIPASALRAFLTKHASTLKELRLIDCILDGDRKALATWASNNMRLAGIQFEGLRAEEGWSESTPAHVDFFRSEHETLWLGGRENCIVRGVVR